LRKAYEEEKTIDEINKILIANNQDKLSIIEEMSFQKERENLQNKKRENIIRECLEERMNIFGVNCILNQNNFENLSIQELEKYKNLFSNETINKKEHSEQFKRLYRNATKKFHPDRFSEKNKKEQATLRMKELNQAKDKNDYFLLKELIQKYEKEDYAE
jgi:hypothetical protein